jgi:hypothetical protein
MLQTRIVSTKSSLITLNPVRYCNMKWGDVADGSKGDLTAPESDFRFAPESGPKSDMAGGPFRANGLNRSRGRALRRAAWPCQQWMERWERLT